MTKSNRLYIVVRWLFVLFVVAATVLTFQGKLIFGHGLGDLVFVLGLGLLAIATTIINVVISRIQKTDVKGQIGKIVAWTYVVLALLILYMLTYGRGSEHLWNGDVFG